MKTLLQRFLAPLCGCLALAVPAAAQLDFDGAPIHYSDADARDPVAQLAERIETGEVQLDFDADHGYLPSLLAALDIPVSSQALVFSKTSLQLRRISPQRPRALYFNDDVYVGFCQQGDVLEIASVDPRQGTIFYTLSQDRTEPLRMVRDRGQCLSCHANNRTQGVPGLLVRSVYADRSGHPVLGSGTFVNDDRSPFEERFGGWYVTGTHGSMRHMGNGTLRSRDPADQLDRESGANCTDLGQRIATEPYLSPHSDLVALMVLTHQTQMHNALTRAGFECRQALHFDRIMNRALERPDAYRSESAERRIASAGDKLLTQLLLSGQAPLDAEIAGTSDFAEEFQARGPRDARGRSLREFDLTTRLFRYPCSYLIHSEQFDALPAPMLQYVGKRLAELLAGEEDSEDFTHFSRADRRFLREYLRDTKPDFYARYLEP